MKVGNKNAEKWTESKLLPLLGDMRLYAIENESYAIVSVLVNFNLYAEWWSMMTNKFYENENVSKAIKEVECIIEKNIIQNTMTGDAKSAAMAIFLLKNKFGYKDATQTDVTTNGKDFNINEIYGSKDKEA